MTKSKAFENSRRSFVANSVADKVGGMPGASEAAREDKADAVGKVIAVDKGGLAYRRWNWSVVSFSFSFKIVAGSEDLRIYRMKNAKR
jgi:hypothetical protein